MNEMIVWSPGVTLEGIEKQVILKAFRFYRGNKTVTAQSLGISIRTLESRMEKYEQDGIAQKRAEEARRKFEEDFLVRQRGPYQNYNGTQDQQEAQRAEAISSAASGVRVESPLEPSSKQSVPVQERKEVQKVLQGPATKSRSARSG